MSAHWGAAWGGCASLDVGLLITNRRRMSPSFLVGMPSGSHAGAQPEPGRQLLLLAVGGGLPRGWAPPPVFVAGCSLPGAGPDPGPARTEGSQGRRPGRSVGRPELPRLVATAERRPGGREGTSEEGSEAEARRTGGASLARWEEEPSARQQDARRLRAAQGGGSGGEGKAQDDPDTQRRPSCARPGPGAPGAGQRARGRVGLLSCIFPTFHSTRIHLL